MYLLFSRQTPLPKPRKILFFSCDIWKTAFLLRYTAEVNMKKKVFYSRSSVIPKAFRFYTLKIHNGMIWKEKFIFKWSVGFKLGAISWTRKPAIYKAKQLRKKKNKLKKLSLTKKSK